MDGEMSAGADRLRAAELIGSSCLATDLAMGFPFEHGLQATLVAMRLAELVGVDRETASQTYYACLLMFAGCTTDSDVAADIFGGSQTEHIVPVHYGAPLERVRAVIRTLPSPDAAPPRRAVQVVTRLPRAAKHASPHFAAFCEAAQMLAERMGLPPEIHGLFSQVTERWDGKGALKRAQGEDIPASVRIAQVARDAVFQQLVGGNDHAAAVVRERAGHAFDPEIAGRFAAEATDILAATDASESLWEATLTVEPHPQLAVEGAAIDRGLAALGSFADLVCPSFSGHSSGVAGLATAAAERCGFADPDIVAVRRAAVLHDVGRVAVDPRIWSKPDTLTAHDWEQVRLHAYHTERIFSRVPQLASVADIARYHHERLDGTGYHRNLAAASLSRPARLLAAADAFHAMTEPRPHRPPLPTDEAARILAAQAGDGRHDRELVAVLVETAGEPAPRIEPPAGLTEREAEVIGLVARGLPTRQVARELEISPKTADRHIQNAYHKIGVSTRAGATLFAVEHGLVPWGELPIPGGARAP